MRRSCGRRNSRASRRFGFRCHRIEEDRVERCPKTSLPRQVRDGGIRYRSPEPVLTPELPKEREGIVPNVVFPTAIDRRDDLGLPNRFDVYYGMADNRIGVARLDLLDHLPPETSLV